MKIRPTPATAALAGAFAGVVMPALWSRLASDSTYLIIAFLLVVALPAHAFVAGFGWQPKAGTTLDTALLKRVGTWLAAAAAAAFVSQALHV